ncbi:hypothetical protein NE664_14160, partial [Anaerotignum faecicola]|nr:hypothetical protein [Anaerotignum faecicola]
VSRYFLSKYGADAGIGEKVMLSSESFHGEYAVTGIMEGYKEKEVNGTSILLSKEALRDGAATTPLIIVPMCILRMSSRWMKQS